jgi:L-ascorbate metabolism protein UlaG (beta-lactamase superfamily)
MSLRAYLLRIVAGLGVLLVLGSATLLALAWRGMGTPATGARRARMEQSPEWHDGHFENPEPLHNDLIGMFTGMLEVSPDASPRTPVPVQKLDPKTLRTAPITGLRVTWLGHSSNLVELDGVRVLTDPAWSERSSPLSMIGPKRWFVPPIALADLPKIDAVLISHDHYDHLDHRTIMAMKNWPTTFVVPLGIGADLEYWGVPAAHMVELDWWQHTRVGPIDITCTPARHASGRTAFDKDQKLWAGYALIGPKHRVFFSGDTGLFPALREVGKRFGPFDVTLIETGQYHAAWPDWHIGPEQAVLAHQWLRGKVMLPVHWGKFQLAYHSWTEPLERVLAAAERAHVQVIAPRPGQSIEPELAPPFVHWWPELPFQSAREAPIVSSRIPAGWIAPGSLQ